MAGVGGYIEWHGVTWRESSDINEGRVILASCGSTVEEQESWIDKSANRVLSHLYQLELSSLPIFQCNIRIQILLMELLREYFFCVCESTFIK